jgi:hypothetical protein
LLFFSSFDNSRTILIVHPLKGHWPILDLLYVAMVQQCLWHSSASTQSLSYDSPVSSNWIANFMTVSEIGKILCSKMIDHPKSRAVHRRNIFSYHLY